MATLWSTGIAQAGSNAVDAEENDATQRLGLVGIAGMPQPAQQGDLDVVDRVHVGVAQPDRLLQPWLVVQKLVVPGDAQQGLLGPHIFGADRGKDCCGHLVLGQTGVEASDVHIGFAERHLRVVDGGAKEGPVAIHLRQQVPAGAVRDRLQRVAGPGVDGRSQTKPAGEVDAVCVQAKTYGIARRSRICWPALRRAGRLPMLSWLISAMGVAA